ncbi:MAG: hypothetical protein ACEY3M_01715, partial [Wolbachia sp.]
MKSNLSFIKNVALNCMSKLIGVLNIKKVKHFIVNKYNTLHKEMTVLLKKSKNLLNTNIEIG